jgi:chromosome segregation ATPase
MKRALVGLILFCCSLTFTVAAQDHRAAVSPPSDLTAVVEQLSAEVRRLQLELSELKIEAQQRRVRQAEEELKQAQTARERLTARRDDLQHEIAVIDLSLSLPELPAAARPELEAKRLHLSSQPQDKLQAEENRAAAREVETIERLGQERQRLQEMTRQSEELRRRQKRVAGTR